jgi:hypothetical protein
LSIMQTTMIRGAQSASSSAQPVWDLGAASQRRFTPRARPSHAGPVAAAFGVVALGAALLPSVAIETRLFFTIGFGVISALVGFSALRRRQTRTALLLAVVGVAAPVLAIAAIVLQSVQEPATVTSSTVQRATLQPDSSALVPSHEFGALTSDEQGEMKAFLVATVLQLQTMHGSWAPFPRSVAVSNGVLVEGDGILRGASLGAMPRGEILAYEVSSDGTAFRVAISSSSDPSAVIRADRAAQILTAG